MDRTTSTGSDEERDRAWGASAYLALSLILLFLFGIWQLGSNRFPEPGLSGEKQGLFIRPEQLTFGNVWEERAFKLPLTNCNKSAKDVFIDHFDFSCTCANITPEATHIPSGQSVEVMLTLNLAKGANDDDPTNNGWRDFSASFSPIVRNEPARKARSWVVTGKCKRGLEISPPALFLREELIPGQADREMTAKLAYKVPVSDVTASCPPSYGSVHVSKEREGQDYIVTIKLSKHIPPGAFSFAVDVEAISTVNRVAHKTSIPVEGTVTNCVAALPTSIVGGIGPVGSFKEESVELTSKNGRPFSIKRVLTPDGISIKRTGGIDGQSETYLVRIDIRDAGSCQKTVTFIVNQGDSDLSIPFSVSYHGVAKNEFGTTKLGR